MPFPPPGAGGCSVVQSLGSELRITVVTFFRRNCRNYDVIFFLVKQNSDHVVSLPALGACPSMEEEAQEVSPPALGAGGGVARPGAGWAHVTQKEIDGKSGWQCSFCNKRFAGMNHTRVGSYI